MPSGCGVLIGEETRGLAAHGSPRTARYRRLGDLAVGEVDAENTIRLAMILRIRFEESKFP